jgi:hypothetical protein
MSVTRVTTLALRAAPEAGGADLEPPPAPRHGPAGIPGEFPSSEPDGQDLNGNGVAGEKVSYTLEVAVGSKQYSKTVPSPEGGAGATAIDFGTLGEADLVHCQVCTITGVATDLAGSPVAGVDVWAEGDYGDQYDTLCPTDTACAVNAQTAADGSYSVKVPMCTEVNVGLNLNADVVPGHAQSRTAGAVFVGCPAAPYSPTLDGEDTFSLTETVTSGVIAWSPTVKVGNIWVNDSAGNAKWAAAVDTDGSQLTGPITYGTAPAGWVQSYPDPTSGDTPAPLAEGDQIHVDVLDTTAAGYTCDGSGDTYFHVCSCCGGHDPCGLGCTTMTTQDTWTTCGALTPTTSSLLLSTWVPQDLWTTGGGWTTTTSVGYDQYVTFDESTCLIQAEDNACYLDERANTLDLTCATQRPNPDSCSDVCSQICTLTRP